MEIKIKNALWSPLTIEFDKGRTLTLRPRETKEISDTDFKSDGCQKLLRDAKIFILPE